MIKSILMYLMDFNQLAILVPLTIMEDCVFCKIINKEIPVLGEITMDREI